MMTMGSWMIRVRDARPLRDVLGVVLLAATALLYAAERHGAEAAQGPAEVESTVVVEPAPAPDFTATRTAREVVAPAPGIEMDSRC